MLDVLLQSAVVDEGSPYGVEYSTRRLRWQPNSAVSCEDPSDALWCILAAGIPERATDRDSPTVMPTDGLRFWNALPGYFRYHYLGPFRPLLLERTNAQRPDRFRIQWVLEEFPGAGHGVSFGYRTPTVSIAIAAIRGWGFMHEYMEEARLGGADLKAGPRTVEVALISKDSPQWSATTVDAEQVISDAKAFLRQYLLRFFERRTVGLPTEDSTGPTRVGPFYLDVGC